MQLPVYNANSDIMMTKDKPFLLAHHSLSLCPSPVPHFSALVKNFTHEREREREREIKEEKTSQHFEDKN
jgi:hypothetical protein